MWNIIKEYGEIKDKRALEVIDVKALARTVLHFYKDHRVDSGEFARRQLLDFAKSLATALVEGELACTGWAVVKLLHYFAEIPHNEDGLSLWEWVHMKASGPLSEFGSANVYGAGISLLMSLQTPFHTIEKIFEQAKSLYGGPPSRSATMNLGIPSGLRCRKYLGLVLYRSILDARLKHNHWREAYLLASSALQTLPKSDRVFEGFIQRRPIVERYTMLHLAFRMGNLYPPLMISVIDTLDKAQRYESSDIKDALVVDGVLRILHDYVSYGGGLSSNNTLLPHIFTCLFTLLPHRDWTTSDTSLDKSHNETESNFIAKVDALKDCLGYFVRKGMAPGASGYAAFISWGGWLQQDYLIQCGINGMKEIGYQLKRMDYLKLLKAYGHVGNAEHVRLVWLKIIDMYSNTGVVCPGFTDWSTLITAANDADIPNFAHEQVASTKEWQRSVHPDLYEKNLTLLSNPRYDYLSVVMKSNSYRANWKVCLDEALQRVYAIAQRVPESPMFSFTPQMPSWLSAPEIPEEWSERMYRQSSILQKKRSEGVEEWSSKPAQTISPYEIWKLTNDLLVRAYCYQLKNPSISDDLPPVEPWDRLRRPEDGALRRETRDLEKFAAKQLEVDMDMIQSGNLRFNEAEWRRWIEYLRRPPDES